MKNTVRVWAAFWVSFLLSHLMMAQGSGAWPKDAPANVGLDDKVLTAFDADIAAGKYSLIDSFGVYRCGKMVFERKYDHDYGKIYGKQAKERGPLNARLTGPVQLL